jgi:MFS family permease
MLSGEAQLKSEHVAAAPAEVVAPSEDLAPTARRSRLLLTVAGLGIFLSALDQTVIVTALWPISTDLGIPISELDKAAWVVTAYLLGYTVALPLMGRVADVFGQKRIYLVSLGIFLLGSVGCALAPNLPFLVAARAVQAVGGGALLPVGMAMVRHLYPERRVPFMLGILGAVAEAGGVIGPLWGALVLNNMEGWLGIAGWRWIFWVNVPLVALFAGLMLLAPPLRGFPGKIDWAGAGLLGGALLALSLGLATPGSVGAWAGLSTLEGDGGDILSAQSLALFAASLVLFALFWWRQHRAAEPLLPPELFSRHRWAFAAANLTNLLVGAALIITMVNVPLYIASVVALESETQEAVVQGGLMLLRMTALIPVGAVVGGLLGGKVEYRWIAVAGLVITAAGFWQMSTWTQASADEPITWLGLGMNGLGFGLLISPVTATALQWAGLRRAALAAASVNLARMIGMMVSLSILTVWGLRHFQSRMANYSLSDTPPEEYLNATRAASLEVYTWGFFFAAIICLAAIPFAIWLRRDSDSDVRETAIF